MTISSLWRRVFPPRAGALCHAAGRVLNLLLLVAFSRSPVQAASWDGRAVVVVAGSGSVRDPAERPVARAAANRVGAWLEELGLSPRRLEEQDLSPDRLVGARLLILPYNPEPDATMLERLAGFRKAGGQVIVCYGASSELAALMEVTLEPFVVVTNAAQIGAFVLNPGLLPGAPPVVRQASHCLIPAYPRTSRAEVLAYWADATGHPSSLPAWVHTSAGFWMSHILLGGDDENKKTLLLAMVATTLPEAWSRATAHLLAPDRPFGDFRNLEEARRALAPEAGPAGATGGAAGYQAARAFLGSLVERYARGVRLEELVRRGVWLDSRSIPDAREWRHVEAELDRAGINTVFLSMGQPLDLMNPRHLLRARHRWWFASERKGVRIHAWLVCLNVEGAATERLQKLEREHRLQVTDSGEVRPWLCPSDPQNTALVVSAAVELARSGLFDGLQLDYIRCDNAHSCYCSGCRARFEKRRGQAVGCWPEEVRTGVLAEAYARWRADRITELVGAVRSAVRGVDASLVVSAAVYGSTPSCYASVAQDWPAWLRNDQVDFVCPMDYTADPLAFGRLLKAQAALPEAARIYPGLGVGTSQSRLRADEVVAQLKQVQEAGFRGFSLFEWTPSVSEDVLPCFGMKGGR